LKVKLEKAPEDVLPRCPFCKCELETLWVKSQGRGIVEQREIIMCPNCRSFLGYGAHGH
jgi:uncharacterized protein with PIN domain